MADLRAFADILTENAPLAPLVGLRVGGPAQYLARPRSIDELTRLLGAADAAGLAWRMLGAGTNVLPPDETTPGLVVVLTEPAFGEVQTLGQRIKAGGGCALADLISAACKSGLSGLEPLAGSDGTVGGALRTNVGDLGQFVVGLDLWERGKRVLKPKADLRFGYRRSNIDDAVVLAAEFELAADAPDAVLKRVKKYWMSKRAQQPFGEERSAHALVNPRGSSAEELVERAGLRSLTVGGAALSQRDLTRVVARDGCTSQDVHRLLEQVLEKVSERTGVQLGVQLDVW